MSKKGACTVKPRRIPASINYSGHKLCREMFNMSQTFFLPYNKNVKVTLSLHTVSKGALLTLSLNHESAEYVLFRASILRPLHLKTDAVDSVGFVYKEVSSVWSPASIFTSRPGRPRGRCGDGRGRSQRPASP